MSAARAFTMTADGAEDAVLLLHGLTGAPVEMHGVGKMLRRSGFTVHAPLLAGHGGGPDMLLASGWRDWLESAEAAHRALARDHARVHVGGICLGAMLAVALAARVPTAAIAAYGTTFRYDGWAMPPLATHPLLIKALAGLPIVRRIGFPEQEPFGLKDAERRSYVIRQQRLANGGRPDAFPLGAVRQLYLLADHVAKVAGGVTTPTLIVHARDDDTASLANAYALQRRLGGPSRIEILDDSYHLIHVDRQMERVADATGRFFAAARDRPAAIAA